MTSKAFNNRGGQGFTLIELLIVVGILGILASIAYPNYQEYIRNAKRADAETALLELAHFMERYHTANGRYVDGAGNAPALPFTAAPKDGTNKSYDLAFAAGTPTATTYILEAIPKATMTGDKCGTLTLANTGAKGQKEGATLSQCWRR